jgi:lipoprotein NlpI
VVPDIWKYVVAFCTCSSNWSLAVHDLNSVLNVDPQHAEARFYRGRVNAELHQWHAALVDFSAAIHLNPNNAQAFFHRGCLLRKLVLSKALFNILIFVILGVCLGNSRAVSRKGSQVFQTTVSQPMNMLFSILNHCNPKSRMNH